MVSFSSISFLSAAEHLVSVIAVVSGAIAISWGLHQRRCTVLAQDAIEGERLYRAILDALPDLIIRMKRDGTYVDIRPAKEFTVLANAKIGANVYDVLPHALARQRLQMAEKAIQTKQPQTSEFQLCVDGTIKWQEACMVDLNDDEVIVLIRDITKQKRMLDQLHRQEAQQRAILTAIPDLIFRIRADGVLLGYVKTNALVDLIPSDIDPIGAHLTDYVPPEIAQRELEAIKQVLGTQKLVVYEQEVCLNHQIQYEEVRVVASGEDEALFIIRDIGDRKRSELARDEMGRQLEQQLNRVLLFEQITNEIRSSLDRQRIFQATVDQVGRLFHADRCLLHLYTAETPANPSHIPFAAEYCKDPWASMVHVTIPLDNNPHAQQMMATDRAIASHRIEEDARLATIHDLCQTLSIKSMLACRTSYQDMPNGAIVLQQCDRYRTWTNDEIMLLEAVAAQVGIALYHAHLLENAEAQTAELEAKNRELEQATYAAESANRAKSTFLATMSHELRTPLNIILGFAQVLQSAEDLSEEHRSDVELILESGEDLLSLINSLLTLTKLEAGMVPIEEHSFEIEGFVDAIELMVLPKTQQKGLTLTIKNQVPSPLFVIADEGKIRQVLIHLIDNAIKFTDQGSIQLTLSIIQAADQADLLPSHASSAGSDAVTLRFDVEDTGCGIAADALGSIFNAIAAREAGKKRSSEGTGLGLALSQKLTQLIGGHLSVTSTEGKGTCFSFVIPMQVDSETNVILTDIPCTTSSLPNLTPPPSAPHTAEPRLVPDDLAGLSVEWIDELYDAAIRCDDYGIQTLVSDIDSTNRAIATKLQHLIDVFQFEDIIHAIDQANGQAKQGQ
jgi:signal transduction histidine kinase/PAS domain-containing protein